MLANSNDASSSGNNTNKDNNTKDYKSSNSSNNRIYRLVGPHCRFLLFILVTGIFVWITLIQEGSILLAINRNINNIASIYNNDINYRAAILPLQDWETRSMNENSRKKKCKPPRNTPNTCCLGSMSAGGPIFYDVKKCRRSLDDHVRLANYTIEYLQRYPVIEQQQQQQQEVQPRQQQCLLKQDCDVCRIIDYLMINEWILSFQGDSMTKQTIVGLECELRRRGYIVESTYQDYGAKPRWRYGMNGITTLIITYPFHNKETTTKTRRQYCSGNEDSDNSTRSYYKKEAIINFFFVYRVHEDGEEVTNIILPNTDILVFDHGLHYHIPSKDEFETDMTRLLRLYRNKASHVLDTSYINNYRLQGIYTKPKTIRNLTLLAWRETTAQHFNTPGGYYVNEEISQQGCFPHLSSENNNEGGYHLSLMERVALNTNYTILNAFDKNFSYLPTSSDVSDTNELVVLPYREFTLRLHYLHDNEGTDCSHFCNDPHIWLPIWRSLRIAMDRATHLQQQRQNNKNYIKHDDHNDTQK